MCISNYIFYARLTLSRQSNIPILSILLARAFNYGIIKAKEVLNSHFPFRYDQTLFEDENKNRMMETKELFEWVLKQPCFEVFFYAIFKLLQLYMYVGNSYINTVLLFPLCYNGRWEPFTFCHLRLSKVDTYLIK